ncbi:rod shape-determining protein RodA [bacterium]|nr:rod shape-determining protein RodA [bacterium]
MKENSIIRHMDFGILGAAIVLVIIGLMSIYSATYASAAEIGHHIFKRQIIWVILGALTLSAAAFVPLKIVHKHAYPLYIASIILLLVVLVIGTGAGTKRWLAFGGLRIQPSEIAKVFTLLALAKYLSKQSRNLNNIRDIGIGFGIIIVPFLLIMRQPDLGSALVFLALALPIMHWAGLSSTILFVLVAPLVSLVSAFNYYSFVVAIAIISLVLFLTRRGLVFFITNFIINISVGILTPIMWGFLKEYQQQRILTFMGLVTDPRGLSYQVIQSKVAIGSGGILGKGFLQGTQTHLRFLPEQHTDFIFCVVGEEFGFLGVVVVLGLFFLLIWRCLKIASSVKSRFSSLMVMGGLVILMFQIAVNVGMTVGIMPVTGLPLPFLSYGGSSLLANLTIVGLILNASRKRFEYF